MKDKTVLELDHIIKDYPSPDGNFQNRVLSDVSLSVSAGSSVAVTGPSGSGKSTLLNIMGALDRPSSGRVVFNGRGISELNDDELSLLRNRDMGFVFQMHHLLPQCSVIENVLIPTLAFPGRNYEEYYEKGRSLLDEVGMRERIDYMPSNLSGGELVRVSVVRALINGPKILLADEPTGSLDNKTAQDIALMLVKLNRENGLTLVVVSHSEELVNKMEMRYELKDGNLNPLI